MIQCSPRGCWGVWGRGDNRTKRRTSSAARKGEKRGKVKMASEQIWSEALRTHERDKPFALATEINVRGSTPREVGAKMIIRDDGQFGTIGGGSGEAEVFRKARLLLEEGAGARLTEVDLTGDFDQQEIGSCGGIMGLFIDLWSPKRDLETAPTLAEAASPNRPAALLTRGDAGAESGWPGGVHTVVHA